MIIVGKSVIVILMVLSTCLLSEVGSQKPCVSNKIAPRRRSSYGPAMGRTISAYIDLFTHNNNNNNVNNNYIPPNPYQDEQQEDDDDCIEDYDETDLSFLTSQRPTRRPRYPENNNRLFPWLFGNRPQNNIPQSTLYTTPSSYKPTRPENPTRPGINIPKPVYNNGGYFGSNFYQQPSVYDPSHNLKPVYEGNDQVSQTYRPGVIGGLSGQVIGVTQVRPTTSSPEKRPYYTDYQSNTDQPIRNPRQPKRRPINRSNSVIGAFVDLLF